MTLSDYNAKRIEWTEWLSGDKDNSIMPQIINLISKSAIIRVIVAAIQNSPKDTNGNNMLNGLIWTTFYNQLAISQAVAIRRLLDKRKDVYSLKRLLDDINNHSHLITRKNVLKADGFELDIEDVERKFLEWSSSQTDGNAVDFPKEVNVNRVNERYDFFDKLADVTSKNRNEDDCLSNALINKLLKILDGYKNIISFVNKSIAHAATIKSRAKVDSELLKVTFDHICEAEEQLCKIAHLMQELIEYHHSTVTVVQSFGKDMFIYMDRPLVQSEKLG